MNKIILFLSLFFSYNAVAQMECLSDADRLCGEYNTRPERTSCLLLNKDKIKDLKCRTRISNQTQAGYDLCLNDYFKYCEKKYPASLSSAYKCLISNRDSLSESCKNLLPTN